MLPQIVCLLQLLCISILQVVVVQADPPIIAKSGCKDTCGRVSVPFPWGIGVGCFLDSWFEIECKASPRQNGNGSFKPFLSKFDIEVKEINLESSSFHQLPSLVVGIPPLNTCATETQRSFDLRGSPYNFSKQNVFVMEGCPGSAILVDQNDKIMAGCGTFCNNNNNNNTTRPTDSCYGVWCCQTSLPFEGQIPFSVYHVDFNLQASVQSGEGQNCLVGALIKSDFVNHYVGKLSISDPPSSVPVVLSWGWISKIQPNNPRANCVYGETGLICFCEIGFYGNPYVFDGCQVPEECKGCHGYCLQNKGTTSYFCDSKPRLAAILGAACGGVGLVLLVICSYWLYNFVKRRRKTKRRVKAFKKMLQKHQSSNGEGVVERTKVFTHKELDKATNHFNENRILGQGGQGIVYKGMLTDGRIVAIKIPKLMDETQMEQFINEVAILSQINHRNIVKLFGCCLETKVPLLVYEFVPNGALSKHIHGPDEDFAISWRLRLKIAADSAGAIAYLHSSSSIPIYHRDIKSSNILLDDKYKAKVSDFGTSKVTTIDQTHMTTLVRGTMGYLDPEYFQSNQFTEKSDVYSFGVVLLELLTGKKPIYRDETREQKNLATNFLFLMHNSRLFDILDPQVVKDAKEEELMVVADLAKRCLSENGRMRPTMKEVAMILEMIIKSPTQRPMQDQQAFWDREFGENAMDEISNSEFMSNPITVDVCSSLLH